MKIELEKNLNSDLNRFFKMLNKYDEETLKILGVTKSETKQYNEIIF